MSKVFFQLSPSLPTSLNPTIPFFQSVKKVTQLVAATLGTSALDLSSDDIIKLQHKIAFVRRKKQVLEFINVATMVDKAKLVVLAVSRANDWLKTIPSERELFMGEFFLIILHLYLGLDLLLTLPSSCLCGNLLDKLEIHLLTCNHGGGTILRHDVIG